MKSILFILVAITIIGFLFYAYRKKWFFLSQVDYERYEANKPLGSEWKDLPK